jgi:hypothetical protein
MINREQIRRENEAHKKLKQAGFKPQGKDVRANKVVIFEQSTENFNVYYFNSWSEAVSVLIDRTAPDGQKIMTYEQIREQNPENCELLAICNNGKQYPASYNKKLKSIFFAIPHSVKIIGYIGA